MPSFSAAAGGDIDAAHVSLYILRICGIFYAAREQGPSREIF
jgi:hypothetical protein